MTKEQLKYIKDLETRAGKLKPEKVLDAAEPEDSPIHDCFDWDDATAAHSHRLEQARTLIRRVHIEITYEESKVRVVRYVRDPSKSSDKPGYVNVTRPKGNVARRVFEREWEAVIAMAERAAGITKAKAEELEDGEALVSQAEGILEQLNRMIGG